MTRAARKNPSQNAKPLLSNFSESQRAGARQRPDPLFKELIREVALETGLQIHQTELSQFTRVDLVLAVPAQISLENTLFDFFRPLNVVEFKSENDPLNIDEFIKNAVRVYLVYLQEPLVTFERLLNVIITARQPREFLKTAPQEGCPFVRNKDRPWLYEGRFGFQEVRIVNCEKLPIEKRYFPWLLFAPAKSRKWRDYIVELERQNNKPLLQAARVMRPKEYAMVLKDIERLLDATELSPAEFEQLERDRLDAIKILLKGKKARRRRLLAQILGELDPEELTQIMSEIKIGQQEANQPE